MELKTKIEHEGQEYVDEPIYVFPKPSALAIGQMFNDTQPQPVLTGHSRIKLRWMKPGPDGKLVPK